MSITKRIEDTHIEPSEESLSILNSLLITFNADTVAARREGLAELLISLFDVEQIANEADTRLTAYGLYNYLEVREHVYPKQYRHPLVFVLRLLLAHERSNLVTKAVLHDRAASRVFLHVWTNHIKLYYPHVDEHGQEIILTLLNTVMNELDKVTYEEEALELIRTEKIISSKSGSRAEV